MARLIDADALYETLCKHPRQGLRIMHSPDGPDFSFWGDSGNDFATMIAEAPTADAAEVVRCKDCKHCLSDAHGLWCFRDYEYNLQPDDFCSHGERRADHGQ